MSELELIADIATENDIRNTITEYLRYEGWLVLRINSGAAKVKDEGGKRRWFWFAKWFILGEKPQTAGVSDLLCFKAGQAPLAIETKRSGNTPTEAQKRFMAEWTAHGGMSIVAYSVDDIEKVLDQ